MVEPTASGLGRKGLETGGGELVLIAGVRVVGTVVSSHLRRSSWIRACSSRSQAVRSARWVAVRELVADSAVARRMRRAAVSSLAEARSDSRSFSCERIVSRSDSRVLHLRFWLDR